ncbi:hypothetical protein NA78x_000472 [Anatilimnocola sp. NA78]|uniref:hypothetical protein n=1 Tax=Anatilimnocola sp. NA78 TaxID=3415683 RepID=UPI003CE4BE24
MSFEPNSVERLRSHGLPITCGVYPKKSKRELTIHVLPGTSKLTFGRGGGLTEIRYAATGFLHVRRSAYQTIQQKLRLPTCNTRWKRPMTPYFQPLIQEESWGSWYLAEDFAFSERARRCGIKIMADTSFRLGHIGSHCFSWEEAGCETKRFGTFTYYLGSKRDENAGDSERADLEAGSAEASSLVPI